MAATEEMVPSATIAARAYSDDVKPYLTHADEGILTLPRADAHEQHIGTIGWRLENIWPLAWILGFDPKPALQGMADDSIISKVMTFLPRDSQTAASFLKDSRIRPLSEVDALEDLFYCAHNAVRSAQLGGDAVPKDFDPISDGGVVHERRHALTWALSPGVAWDDRPQHVSSSNNAFHSDAPRFARPRLNAGVSVQHMRHLTIVGLLIAASAAGASTPVEPQAEDAPTELDPITVTPPYLYDGDRQLGRFRKTLPDMGGDSPVSGVVAAIRKFYEQRKDPNKLDPFQQDMLLRALGEGRDF